MKKLILFCIFMAIGMNMNSQTNDFNCATPYDDTPDPTGVYSKSIDPSHLVTFDPVVFNVYFWGINEDDGTSTKKLTRQMCLKIIADLNIKYNEANMFFKYYGYDFIDLSRFYSVYLSCDDPNDEGSDSCLDEDFRPFLDDNPQYINNDAINYYVPRHTIGFAGAGYKTELRIVINAGSFENGGRISNHEMGHVFNLGHTHSSWNAPICELVEHVTREEFLPDGVTLNPDFNADVAGDRVVDTAAMPDFRNEKCVEEGYAYPYTDCPYDTYYYLEGCTYNNPNGADCLDPPVPYQIQIEDVRNLMAYTSAECGLDLTTGQHIRMRDYIVDYPDRLGPVTTTVESLYEPYSGVYLNGFSLTDTQARFQPGFDYKYLNCYPDGGFPQPSDYSNTSFSYIEGGLWWYSFNKEIEPQYFNSIIHKNGYAIRIEQLEQQPRKCWNNGISTGGTVIKFNDDVFNTNVTITSQDSTAINNEELINDLQPGLYNVIKDYPDGRTEETVILKENN